MPAIKPHEDIKADYIRKKSTKKPKTVPACADGVKPHTPVVWGSDARYGICRICGKHLEMWHYDGFYLTPGSAPNS